MSENKRFYVDKSGDFRDNKTGVAIVDFGYNFNGMECRHILELMNSLNDENEQLKQSVKRQQLSNDECSKYIEEVAKENEQLKKDNAELKEAMKRMVIEMMGGDE